MVDAHHHAQVHTSGDNLVDGHVHHARQVIGGHKFGELEHLALGGCHCSFLAKLLAVFFTLLTTAGSGGLLAVLGSKTGQRLLHLALNVLLADLWAKRTAVLALILVALAALFVLAATAFAGLLRGLVASAFDIDFLLADAFALFLGSALGLGLGDALIALLLLALLAGTGLLVDGCQVNLAHHLELRASSRLGNRLVNVFF